MLLEFVDSTLLGQESALYKSCETSLRQPRSILKSRVVLVILQHTLVDYLNACYKSLILNDDEYITKQFDAMTLSHGHSAVCLLNILASMIFNTANTFDRSLLDISSYESYMKAASDQLSVIRLTHAPTLQRSLSHTCSGMDIKSCDPNKPLFVGEVSPTTPSGL